MRTELYQWMKSLAFFHVLTTALLHILPDKRYEQYIRLFMGFLLVLLICTPIFAVVGKSEELLSGFSNNYGREEQVRMETEAEGIRETFLKGAYEQELKNQVQGILRKEGIFSAENIWGYFSDKDMEVHSLDLCESCYDSWVSGFAVPVEVQEATEIPGV